MPKPARRYDVFLPLTFNDGRTIPRSCFDDVEAQLLDRFGGVTIQQPEFPFRGLWRAEDQVYQDRVTVMTVLDFRKGGSARFIANLKRHLLEAFEQLEILITETTLRVH